KLGGTGKNRGRGLVGQSRVENVQAHGLVQGAKKRCQLPGVLSHDCLDRMNAEMRNGRFGPSFRDHIEQGLALFRLASSEKHLQKDVGVYEDQSEWSHA